MAKAFMLAGNILDMMLSPLNRGMEREGIGIGDGGGALGQVTLDVGGGVRSSIIDWCGWRSRDKDSRFECSAKIDCVLPQKLVCNNTSIYLRSLI